MIGNKFICANCELDFANKIIKKNDNVLDNLISFPEMIQENDINELDDLLNSTFNEENKKKFIDSIIQTLQQNNNNCKMYSHSTDNSILLEALKYIFKNYTEYDISIFNNYYDDIIDDEEQENNIILSNYMLRNINTHLIFSNNLTNYSIGMLKELIECEKTFYIVETDEKHCDDAEMMLIKPYYTIHYIDKTNTIFKNSDIGLKRRITRINYKMNYPRTTDDELYIAHISKLLLYKCWNNYINGLVCL